MEILRLLSSFLKLWFENKTNHGFKDFISKNKIILLGNFFAIVPMGDQYLREGEEDDQGHY